jgi:hypothetical protein
MIPRKALEALGWSQALLDAADAFDRTLPPWDEPDCATARIPPLLDPWASHPCTTVDLKGPSPVALPGLPIGRPGRPRRRP